MEGLFGSEMVLASNYESLFLRRQPSGLGYPSTAAFIGQRMAQGDGTVQIKGEINLEGLVLSFRSHHCYPYLKSTFLYPSLEDDFDATISGPIPVNFT